MGNPPSAATVRFGRNAAQHSIIALPAVRLAMICATGVIAGNYLPLPTPFWLFAILLLLSATALFRVANLASPTHKLSIVSIHLALAMAMAAWTAVRQPDDSPSDIEQWIAADPTPAVFRGLIATPVQLRPDAMAIERDPNDQSAVESVVEIELEAVRDELTWLPTNGRIRALIQGDASRFLVDDHVQIHGTLRPMAPPSNPGTTDMRPVYRQQSIDVFCSIASVDDLTLIKAGPWGLRRAISWISVRGDQVIQEHVGARSGPLTSAIVLGRRQAVDPHVREALLETGTIHLLSVSGLHLGMVAAAVSWLVLLLGWRTSTQLTVVLLACLFYAALTGARPPVLRAAILVTALLLASWVGRQPQLLNSLGLAAIFLMLLDPQNLLQSGTQLSFLAVVTLVIAGRQSAAQQISQQPLEQLIEQTRPWYWNRAASLLSSLVAATKVSFWVWIISAPLVWQAYNIISPVSVLANLLLMIPLTAALILGLFTCLAGLLFETFAVPLGWACRLCMDTILLLVEFCVTIPAGHFWLPAPPPWTVALFYLGLILLFSGRFLFRSLQQRPSTWVIIWIGCWFSLALLLATQTLSITNKDTKQSSLVATFIDVGHGTSVLIQLPNNNGTWLYDAGRMGNPEWSSAPIEDTLWANGIIHLDGLIVSHADADHYNAIPKLVERFSFATFYSTRGLLDDPQLRPFAIKAAVNKQIPHAIELWNGQSIEDRSGQPWARCLHPPQELLDASDNANSVVLEISFAGRTILLPGDLEGDGTTLLLQHPRPKAGCILMAPHHGSLQEDPLPLLDWARPETVIVSGGPRAKRPEVQRLLGERGAAVYSTANLGAIRIQIASDGSVTKEHWDEDHWQLLEATPSAGSPNKMGRE